MAGRATAGASSRTNAVSRAVPIGVILALAAWAGIGWFHTVQCLLHYYTPVPAWDYWRIAEFIKYYRALELRVFWQQHNEHRILFPEIVFAADELFARGRAIIPLAFSFVSYVGVSLLLAWTFVRECQIAWWVRIAGALLGAIVIGWQGSAVFLANPFLFTWTLTQIGSLLSLAFLGRLVQTNRHLYLAAGIIAAIVATYSSGQGLLLWPVLIAAAALLRLQTSQIVGLALACAVSVGVYFVGYSSTGKLAIGQLFHHPLYVIEFLGSYFSMPFGGMKSAEFGFRLGIAELCGLALLVISWVRSRWISRSAATILFGWLAFAFLTALLTAAGRMDASDPLFGAAKASRYLSFPLVTWAVFILLCLGCLESFRSRAPLYTGMAVFAVLLLVGLPKLRWWLRAQDNEYANEQFAALALAQDIEDPSVVLNIFPDPGAVFATIPELKYARVSVFDDRRTRWLGRSATQFASLAKESISGEITYTFPVVGGVELAGWADESFLSGATGDILLTNEAGKIVGFGRKLRAGFPPVLTSPRIPSSFGWVGFANLRIPCKSIAAWVVRKHQLLRIEGSAAVPADGARAQTDAGPPIGGVTWQMDPIWRANQLPSGIVFEPGPGRPFYSSWQTTAAPSGRITSSAVGVPANGCVIVPILNGTTTTGISLNILDADTNATIASAPFQRGARDWMFWQIHPPPNTKAIRIAGEDQALDHPAWLAVATPRTCR